MIARFLFFIIVSLSLFHPATAQSTQAVEPQLDFGVEGLIFPPPQSVNAHTPRTAQLLGEAYRRHEPLNWKRAQYVAALGRIGLADSAAYLADAMKDPAPLVRAEAARSAGRIGDASQLPQLEKLLGDADSGVRRAAVVAAASLARDSEQPTQAIERGLADEAPEVVAVAIEAAWLPEHAAEIAKRLPSLPAQYQADAALALGRLKATAHASVVIGLLRGDVPQRVAALQALTAMGDAGQVPVVLAKIADPHPTVRRAAVAAMGRLVPAADRQTRAIEMLGDPDLTVRQSAAEVLTPLPSSQALSALTPQLAQDYVPLHGAVRAALTHSADATTRQATEQWAVAALSDADPRRREDASYVLGRLHCAGAMDQHIALLRWELQDPAKSDWSLVAQAAESLGLIGDTRALPALMDLITPAPEASAALQRPQRDTMSLAMANALVAAARLHHAPALDDAVRILQISPDSCPRTLRTAAAFAIGMLAPPDGKAPQADKLLSIYASIDEDGATKFEALKALGNLRHAPAADRLHKIAQSDPSPDLRWIAHWSYQRASGKRVPYEPPTIRREPTVLISDLEPK